MDYYTGFMIEKSLSMDKVFVIALVFSFLAIPRPYQHRVLFWGILPAGSGQHPARWGGMGLSRGADAGAPRGGGR